MPFASPMHSGAVLGEEGGHDHVRALAHPEDFGVHGLVVFVSHLGQRIHERLDVAGSQPCLAFGRLHVRLGVGSDNLGVESGPLSEALEIGREPKGHVVTAASQLCGKHHHGLCVAPGADRDHCDPHRTPSAENVPVSAQNVTEDSGIQTDLTWVPRMVCPRLTAHPGL